MSFASDPDLTRKERREQARTQRKALEEAQAASAKRRTRLTQLGILGAVVVAIIVVIVVATSGGSKKVVHANTKEANKTVAEVTSLIGGIPQNGNVLGNPKAPVTMEYFGDLECPVCKDFTLGALPSLIQSYVRAGKLKIEYRNLETATHDPEVFKTQQIAALAAGKQNKMWHFIELFYREQGEENSGYVTESYLQNLAQQVPGLNLTKWTSDRNNPALTNQLATDTQAAGNAGYTGTPTIVFGKTGGTQKKFEYTSLTDPSSFNAEIEKLLRG
jgi:protein-disulfide isomerase